ncbi:MAG: alpha/beta hydrolase [Gammaproteobacteria bacterium]|nr:alpha/beta hydrolase [Gammaproteobacteria bacterium]MDH3406690.1 alpha/beta hydrolase [Gammaproteobacteria bacterium]
MKRLILVVVFVLGTVQPAVGEISQRVVDIPTRAGVTQRFLLLIPPTPRAAAILFAGGHGGLQITSSGDFGWGKNNFLVRTRELFADKGMMVVVVDAPSDRQRAPYLDDFRQTPEHVTDIQAVIAWIRSQAQVPVWLIGTSRGTQSAAHVAIELAVGTVGPDGLVLTSTILSDNKGRPVPDMPVQKLKLPVLVVHHEQDGCKKCLFSDMPKLMNRLDGVARKELQTFRGGDNQGDPCKALAHHGFNGIELNVVNRIAAWIVAK